MRGRRLTANRFAAAATAEQATQPFTKPGEDPHATAAIATMIAARTPITQPATVATVIAGMVVLALIVAADIGVPAVIVAAAAAAEDNPAAAAAVNDALLGLTTAWFGAAATQEAAAGRGMAAEFDRATAAGINNFLLCGAWRMRRGRRALAVSANIVIAATMTAEEAEQAAAIAAAPSEQPGQEPATFAAAAVVARIAARPASQEAGAAAFVFITRGALSRSAGVFLGANHRDVRSLGRQERGRQEIE